MLIIPNIITPLRKLIPRNFMLVNLFLKFHIKYFRHSHHWSSLCSVPLFTAHQDFGHSTRPFWRNRAFRGNGPTRRRVTTPVRVRKSRKHSTTQDKINKSYFSFPNIVSMPQRLGNFVTRATVLVVQKVYRFVIDFDTSFANQQLIQYHAQSFLALQVLLQS